MDGSATGAIPYYYQYYHNTIRYDNHGLHSIIKFIVAIFFITSFYVRLFKQPTINYYWYHCVFIIFTILRFGIAFDLV